MHKSIIPPSFEHGSGWYRQTGAWAPGSMRDQEARALAARQCAVVVLYRAGQRIPAAELLRADHLSGSLLLMDDYTHPHWHARLLSDPAVDMDLLPRLARAQLERENDGVRLYGGIEIERHEERRQAWLVTPTLRRAEEILRAMVAQGG
ncbi:hypothetical protein HHL11_07045 [Ramlibacter sp. G-1-2-2]|uniref:Uncharacterized protein n=1 Tax=Ramlibacter agri TaxID=2728837 RepID=A0A848H742_9BURK|nr:hypothetical protein [Ramlibacter agri]NML43498.1 hypothetical protein [Ramlibacter agri]